MKNLGALQEHPKENQLSLLSSSEKSPGYVYLLLVWSPKTHQPNCSFPQWQDIAAQVITPKPQLSILLYLQSFIQQITTYYMTPTDQGLCYMLGETKRNTAGKVSVLLRHLISAAHMLCELGKGHKLFCASQLHLKTVIFYILLSATSWGCRKD